MSDLKMPELNHVMIAGRLTRDPEQIRGHEGCKFGLAVDKFRNGKEIVSFFDVVAWGKTALRVIQNIRKGDAVIVTGSLKQDKWESDGVEKSRIEIESFRVDELSWPAKTDEAPTPGDASVPY